MRGPRSVAEREALDAFAGSPRGDRFHVWFRWLTCPFPAVEREVPRRGRILEIGCGHGLASLYLALSGPGRTVVGVDVDAHKIALARAALGQAGALGEEGLAGRVSFDVVEPGSLPDGPFDAVVVIDVLYLLPGPAQQALLTGAVERLAPGGVMVVKEADNRPAWKHVPTVLQERLATRVLRITDGEQVHFSSPERFAGLLADLGLRSDIVRADRGYIHPHVVITGRR